MNPEDKIKELEKKNYKLEEELKDLYAKLSENRNSSDKMILEAFHYADHLMVLSRADSGVIFNVNDAFLKTLGYSREEVIGRTPEDIGLYPGLEESNKYMKLLVRFKKIKDFVITLKNKAGEEKSFLFSADTITLDDGPFLMSVFNPIASKKQLKISESQGTLLAEIFDTVSSYLALFSPGDDKRIYVADINSKVEQIEHVDKNEIIGKCIDDTPLALRTKLVDLINTINFTGEARKTAASPLDDDSEGYYIGFILSSGNIVISWEPGYRQKSIEDINRQTSLFRKFTEMLPVIIYEVDTNGYITYGNKLGLTMFGYSVDDLNRRMHISDVFPDDYQRMMTNLEDLNEPGQVSSNEYYFRKDENTIIPIVTHSYPIFYDGKKIGYRGTVTDVSKHRKYEEQIVREKAFLEHLIDSTPEAIVITDLNGKISLVNKEFTSLFGYAYDEAVNKSIDDLIVPEDLKDEALGIETLASEKQKVSKHTVRIDKSGNRIDVALVASSIFVNDEAIANVGIYRNITTERKNQLLQEILYNISSEALKQMDIKDIYPTIVHELSKIWDTNNFFIAIYNKITDTMSLPFFSDEKDKFYEVPTRGTISGYVIKNNRSVLLREDDLKILEEGGEIDLVGTPCKVWMGVPLNVEDDTIGVMCLQDYNDEDKFSMDDLFVLDFIANQIAVAIQRKIMLDNIIIARQKAEEAAQSKQIFMSTMSHEIRTPLNEVIGITNLLLQGNPREDQMDFLKTLRFSGNHLLTLVNDVLDYNKMESGKIVFEKLQFNLDDFLDEIMRSYSFRSKAKNLTFDIIKEGNLPSEVIGDQIRLSQILSNLLSNALKFTNEGGITVTIRVSSRDENESKLRFSVQDTGIGIAPERHSDIFESFTQASADTSRRFGGSGLGLAICKKLIELQGGTINVDSETGKGSTFTFELSFTVAEEASGRKPEEAEESFRGLEGKRILVAEDNRINFFVANKFLTGWGVNVAHAENGKLALEMLDKQEFDLILMDLHMPVMDGVEATRVIRNSEDPKISTIPIVALTAAIMSENHDKIEELNINDYVLKPFRPHDLFSRILKNVR
ncbi:MAG TPA: PAS domain S-box protein [Bacteroidales bacterium]|nr:PAS domain S-box protein [Bacteroidales bacterium]HPJ58844.1 PAS domain S-box protein [Bacteroidales bacterium]HPR11000.1 PAS domain S-box protein [Bacteroidales bacterium]HRW84474.1 PAS domain S-box protein [Bacteroidales bacterium]